MSFVCESFYAHSTGTSRCLVFHPESQRATNEVNATETLKENQQREENSPAEARRRLIIDNFNEKDEF